MRLSSIPQWSEQAARTSAIALGFSIPISVALDNVFLVLILIFWLVAVNRNKLVQISHHQVALAALALFDLLAIGVAWGASDIAIGRDTLLKYLDLAFVPIFIYLFRDERARRHAWLAFAASMILTLVLSYLLWAGLVEHSERIGYDPLTSAPFKRYLTQNVLMAFSALLFVYLGTRASSTALRYTWMALAGLATVNVILLNPGRTGQLICAALAVYFVYSLWRWKGTLLIVAAIAALIIFGGIHSRLGIAFNEWKAWQPGAAAETSTGQRLEFYRNSLDIARVHPLIGNGTGSFPKVYADHVAGSTMTPTDNPHNEYLNIAIQTGVVGLLMLLYLFYCVWRTAAMLPAAFERHLARGLVITFVIGCLFNSLLMDHVEGLFFAWASGLLFAGLPTPIDSGATVR